MEMISNDNTMADVNIPHYLYGAAKNITSTHHMLYIKMNFEGIKLQTIKDKESILLRNFDLKVFL